jgi:DNA-binding NarL/FixJ family response regulator
LRAVRLVIADDAVLVREGVAALLATRGVDVVGQAGDVPGLLAVLDERPHVDVAVIDIRMPPSFTDEGIRAAALVRQRHPRTAVLVLSQYVDESLALKLLGAAEPGVGYLLKERVANIDDFMVSVTRVASGETVVDAALVRRLVEERRVRAGSVDALSAREWSVLSLVAEGRTDRAIAALLNVSVKTVETHVRTIFRKLDLEASPHDNRRVHAAIWYLRATAA